MLLVAVKKEKRARNEQMARQYRKAESASRGGRGGARAAAQRENDADSEWLSQIFGQHTIFRRDQVANVASGAGRKVCLIICCHTKRFKSKETCRTHVFFCLGAC